MITISLTSSRGDFILYEDEEPVITMKRSGWFSVASEMVYLGSFIEIKPRNIWWRKFDIFDDGRIIGGLSINGWGNMEIEMEGANYKKYHFFFKKKGFLHSRFELYQNKTEHLLTLYAKFNWARFNYDFNVEVFRWEEEDLDIYELLAYCGYCAGIYLKHKRGKR